MPTHILGYPMLKKYLYPFTFLGLLLTLIVLTYKGNSVEATMSKQNLITTKSGLQYEDLIVGNGAECKASGHTVVVHYTGMLTNGQKFDSSEDRGEPFEFEIGRGMVIQGWEEGLVGMKVGGERKLIIPPELGYGSRGFPGLIPENSTLVFNVKLLAVE